MFEGSVSSIPSILAYMNSWLNPHFFFLLLNLMIGTIVFTSTFNNRHQQIPTPPPPPPQITSTNNNNNIGSDEFHDHPELDSLQDSDTHFPQTLTLDPPQQQVTSFEKEVDQTKTETPTLDDVYVQTMVINKSISRSIPDIPVMSKGRMKKSVSMKADIIVTRGYEAETEEEEEKKDEEDSIESRRPATMRERKTTTEKDEYGVDEKADDFINKFKQQLMLQRMDSIGRQREIRVKK